MSETFNNEKIVLLSLQEGSDAALDEIFDHFHTKLCLFAMGLLGDWESARDVVSDVFLKLWNGRQALNIQSLNAFLYKSTFNTARDYREKQRNFDKRNSDWADLTGEDSLSEFEMNARVEAETVYEIYKALEKLPPQPRLILKLFLDGLDDEAIGQQLQLSSLTVRNHRLNGVKLLRKYLVPAKMLVLVSAILQGI